MKKAISFSLFGNRDIYNVGLYDNIRLANEWYEDYDIHIFHDDSIDPGLLSLASEKVVFHRLDCPKVPGYFWRFFLVDDKTYNIVLSRDLDSRLSLREKSAVDHWIASGKSLHVMRDHQEHNFPIMAGMWGVRTERVRFNMTASIQEFADTYADIHKKISDQIYLKQLYATFQNDILAHDDWFRCADAIQFPMDRVEARFVGEIYNHFNEPKYVYSAAGVATLR